MKLIIDIPNDVYEHIKSTKTIETVDYDIVSLYRATKNGTPVSPYCPQCGAKMEVKINENND